MKHLPIAPMLLALLVAATPAGAQAPKQSVLDRAEPKLDPNLPYQGVKSNPVTYEVDFRVVVTPPYQCRVLKVWLPIPPSDSIQQVERESLSSFPIEVTPQIGREPKYGNEFAYFEFTRPQGAQLIRHRFKVKTHEVHWNIDPQRTRLPAQWPAAFEPYLRGEDQSVVIDDRVRKLARDLVPKAENPARDLSAVIRWVNGRLTYDHAAASLQASSQHALDTGRGHCSDYHGLCASMGRAIGYPVRVVYGINPFPKNSPSHCKLEAFIPPYGWVAFDVSETQRVLNTIQADATLSPKEKADLAAAVNAKLFSGFRDNTWFLQTRGSDYDLVPPAARRAPVVRTIYAEADGVALPEPDPGNKEKREFAWMTIHQYKPDREVVYPYKDWKTLLKK